MTTVDESVCGLMRCEGAGHASWVEWATSQGFGTATLADMPPRPEDAHPFDHFAAWASAWCALPAGHDGEHEFVLGAR